FRIVPRNQHMRINEKRDSAELLLTQYIGQGFAFTPTREGRSEFFQLFFAPTGFSIDDQVRTTKPEDAVKNPPRFAFRLPPYQSSQLLQCLGPPVLREGVRRHVASAWRLSASLWK